MKTSSAAYLIIGLFTLAFAKEPKISSSIIDALFTERDPKKFDTTYQKAIKLKVSQQALLEAKFLYYIDNQDFKSLAEMANLLEEFTFSPQDSEVFTLEDDWLAITQYCKALKALQSGDNASFKSHIKEAFWLSPRQASAFAPHIENLKIEEAMSRVTIDKNTTLPNLLDDQSTLIHNTSSLATLLYFWSPWSQEFTETLDDFKLTCEAANKHNFRVIGVLAEQSKEVYKDAKILVEEERLQDLSQWVLDESNHTLARKLRIQNIPSLVLIGNNGKVMFNGHPSSPQLWNAISAIEPAFKRPRSYSLEQTNKN